MEENQIVKQPVKSKSLRQLYKEGHWKTVSNLRFNESKYPFITILNSKGKAQNLYFSKNSSKIIIDTFNSGDNVIGALAEAEVIETKNNKGSIRFKISISNNSKYASNANVQEIFGDSSEESQFSTEDFIKEYYSSDLIEITETQESQIGKTS